MDENTVAYEEQELVACKVCGDLGERRHMQDDTCFGCWEIGLEDMT